MINPLPPIFNYRTFDESDKIIDSNSTNPHECVQCFQVLERIEIIEIFKKKVGNVLLRNEKGCGSYTKVKPITCWEF